jgi:hypothetical protein
MRKIIVHCDNSKSAGCDCYEALLVDDATSDDEIDEIAFELACEQASHYWDVVDPSEVDEDRDEDEVIYTDQIEATREEYDPEKHDMLRCGGGSFEDDFARMIE